MTINMEKIISALLSMDAFIAVVSFNPKKYTINADTSATPIIDNKIRFLLPKFFIEDIIFFTCNWCKK